MTSEKFGNCVLAFNHKGIASRLTWKKEVWEGSSPVLPGGTTTSTGATRPTRAGAPTCRKNTRIIITI
jgi:hypothetical protein